MCKLLIMKSMTIVNMQATTEKKKLYIIIGIFSK